MSKSTNSNPNLQLISIELVLRVSEQHVPLTLKLLYETNVFRLHGYELTWADYSGLNTLKDKNGKPVEIPKPSHPTVEAVWQAYAALLNLVKDHGNRIESIYKIDGRDLRQSLVTLSNQLSNLAEIDMATDKATCFAYYADLVSMALESPSSFTADKILGHCSRCNHGKTPNALPHCDFARATKALQQNWNLLNTDDQSIPLPESIVLTWLKYQARPL